MKRLLNYFWSVFNGIQSSPFIPRLIRGYLLRIFGCSVDSTARIAEHVYIGSNNITIKNNCFLNVGILLDGSAKIYVHEYVRIGPFARILTGSHIYANSVLRLGPHCEDIKSPVIIERGCWIGMEAIIMPGVTIAEGCVIAAGAIVLKSTEANGLYAGNPAKRIKDLPTDLD